MTLISTKRFRALLSCAVVAATISVESAAAPTSAFATPDATVYLAGVDGSLESLSVLASKLFGNNAFTYFDDNGTPADPSDDGNSYRAYFGTVVNAQFLYGGAFAQPPLLGSNVLLVIRAKGGAFWGVGPVARNQAIATLPINAANCPNFANGIYRCGERGIDPGSGTPTGDERVPDFGVSELPPDWFKEPWNVPSAMSQLTPTETANLSVRPTNQLSMGLPMTSSVAPFFMSRSGIGGIFNGILVHWSEVGATPPAGASQVIVCNRPRGSGTQASFNWYFGNGDCNFGSFTATMDDVTAISSGTGAPSSPFIVDMNSQYIVLESATSQDVRTCLTKANNGGVYVFKNGLGMTYSANFGSGGYGAVGILSTESLGKENGWTFRTIDGAGYLNPGLQTVSGTGVSPTKANLISGNWDFVVEVNAYYRKTPNPPAGLKKSFIDYFMSNMASNAMNGASSIAALPGSSNVCGSSNTAKATRNGATCSQNNLRVCP